MPRLEGGLHGLKADPSARADDQDCCNCVMLPGRPAWLTVMCDAGSRPARWADGLKRASKADAVARLTGRKTDWLYGAPTANISNTRKIHALWHRGNQAAGPVETFTP
jgi:hypothetical protein